jgi:hypothetical protein
VRRAFNLFNQFSDIVEGQPRSQISEVARAYLEWRRGRFCPGDEAATQCFIHDLAKRASRPARFRLELRCHVIVKG